MVKPYFNEREENDLKGRLYSYLRDKANRRADITSKNSYENMEKQFLRQKQNRDLNSLAVGLNESANMMGTLGGQRVQDPSLQKMSDDLYASIQGAYENFRTLRQGEEQSNMNDFRMAQGIAGMEHQDWQRGESEKTNELQREKLKRELAAKAQPRRDLVRGVVGSGGAPVVSTEDGQWETRPGYKYDERAVSASQPSYREIGRSDDEILMIDPKTLEKRRVQLDKGFKSQKDKEADDKRRKEEEKAEYGKQQTNRAAETVVQDLGRALEIIEGSYFGAGPWVGKTAMIPGTPADQAQKLLDSAASNIGIDRLQAMREASPTGGALGQVPFQQQKRLEQLLGSIQIDQEEDVLKDNIKRIMNLYNDIIHGEGNGPERFELGFDDQGRSLNRQLRQPRQRQPGKSEAGQQFPVRVRDSRGKMFEIPDQETLDEALQDGAEVIE